MSNNKKKTIGVLIDWIVNPYQNTFLRGIADCTQKKDVNLLCFEGGGIQSNRKYEKERNILYDLAGKEIVDGLVVLAASLSRFVDKETIQMFCRRFHPLPMITISHVLDTIPSISIDNAYGMKNMIDHLIDVHHFENFAFIKGTEGNPDANERLHVFQTTLKERGIEPKESLVVSGDFTPAAGKYAVQLLFNGRKQKCDVIVAANDNMAFGAIEALASLGIRVPEEVAVTGFDNLSLSRYCSPPLTTVRQPLYDEGWKAVELLLDYIDGYDISLNTLLPTTMVLRESCGCMDNALHSFVKKTKKAQKNPNLLAEQKEQIVDAVIDKTEGLFERKFSIDERGLLKDICFDFIHSIQKNEIKEFLRKFNYVIRNIQILGGNIFVLQRLIDGLRINLIPLLKGNGIRTCAEDIGYRAYALVSERMIQEEKYRQNELLNENDTINLLREDLHVTLERKRQIEEIKKRLPELGISECYLSVFDDRSNMVEGGARLILAYNDDGCIDTGDEGIRFHTRKLVPDKIIFGEKRFSIIIEALKDIGFVLFEMRVEDARIYGLLGDIISSALQAASLFNEVQYQKNSLSEHLGKLRKAMGGFIQTMAQTVEVKDPYTFGHLRKVSDLARSIARILRLESDRIEAIRMAGLVHDLGKISIPSEILNKAGKLDEIEFMMIKRHPQVGYDILKTIDFPWPIAEIVYEHHEKLDGSGYPRGLKGDAISLEARILTVADVVEAMSSHRPYREALGVDAALEEINKYKGILYDPDVVDACIKLFKEKGYEWQKY